MRAERVEQPWIQRVDRLGRDPARLSRERDQAQVAGGEHDDLGRRLVGVLRQLVLRADHDRAVLALRAGHLAQAVRSETAAAGSFRHRGPEVHPRFVSLRRRLDLLGLARFLDDLLERGAVALAERRALGLAMIGEHDELHRPRSLLRSAGESGELPVELAQDAERLGSFDSGVMRHLVVARERRVHDGTSGEEVAEERFHLQVALDDRHPRAHERVGEEAAVHARLDVQALLL